MKEYLTEVVVEEESPLIGRTLEDFKNSTGMDMDTVMLNREDNQYIESSTQKG
ncbi:MAG: hypothetical protein K9K76_08375 [Halanaerobiales bacterium]|nr:hypothetical protein [Halanaerobiales bacterium]